MKTLSLTLFMLLALTLQAAAQQRLYRYQCESGRTFEVLYATDQATLTLTGREPMTLLQVRAASGAGYSNGRTTLFTKGNDAFIEEDNTRIYDACVGQLASSSPAPTARPTEPVRGLW